MAQPVRKTQSRRSNVINQFLLEQFYKTNKKIVSLKQEIEQKTLVLQDELLYEVQQLESLQEEILEKRRNGCKVEDGRRILNIKVTKGRRVPKYKEILISVTSEAYVEEIIENTIPTPDKESVEVL